MNDLRSDSIKRIKETDNQHLTKDHFVQLEADKCQSGAAAVTAAEYDYNRSAKEHRQYFIDHMNRRICDPYGIANNNTEKLNNSQDAGSLISDYDDSISINGDNSKDFVMSYGGGGVSGSGTDADGNRLVRNHKRKHSTENTIDSDVTTKIYKNSINDVMQTMPNKFDYMNNFDGNIRARNFEEIQNDEHHRMIGGATENDYRNSNSGTTTINDDSRCNDDNNGNHINVNYASSDDLNQTNTSEHDDKNMSGSDDENGGTKNCFLYFSFSEK